MINFKGNKVVKFATFITLLGNPRISLAAVSEGIKLAPIENFDPRMAPSPTDWKYFNSLSPSARENMWLEAIRNGKNLGSWSWQWRLAWIYSCETEKWSACLEILKQALGDDAAVVRSTAAVTAGRIYSQSQDNQMTQLLLVAAKDPRNFRGGKPLFVAKRILFSLYRIGNENGLQAASKLVANNEELQSYWDKLPKS